MDFLFRLGAVLSFVFSLSLSADSIIQDASEAWAEGVRYKAEAEKAFSKGEFDKAKANAEKATTQFQFLRNEYPAWRTGLVQINRKQLSQMMERFTYFSTLKLEGMSKEELVASLLKLNQSYLEQLSENQKLVEAFSSSVNEKERLQFNHKEFMSLQESYAQSQKELSDLKKVIASKKLIGTVQALDKDLEEELLKVLQASKANFNQKVDLLDEKDDLGQELESLKKSLFEAREQEIKLEKDYAKLEKKNLDLSTKNMSLKTKLNAAQDLVSLSKLKKNSSEERKALLSKLVELQESEARLNISNSALRKNLAEFRKDIKSFDDLDAKYKDLKKSHDKFKLTAESLSKDLTKEKSKNTSLLKALSLSTKTSQSPLLKVQTVDSKQAVLEELQDEILELKKQLNDGGLVVAGEHANSNEILKLKELIQSKDRQAFKDKVTALLALYPSDYQLWYLKAFEAYTFNDYKGAFEGAEQSLNLADGQVSVLELYAKLALKLNKKHEALSTYSKLISMDAENFKYHQSFALALKALGFRDASEKSLIRAHELNKSSKLVVYNLCVLLVKEKERKADAHNWYQKYLELGGKKVSQLETFFNGKKK